MRLHFKPKLLASKQMQEEEVDFAQLTRFETTQKSWNPENGSTLGVFLAFIRGFNYNSGYRSCMNASATNQPQVVKLLSPFALRKIASRKKSHLPIDLIKRYF
jgi:hypothetical protein